LTPLDGIYYVAFTDPSGGSRDAFTVAITHLDGERVIVDCARAWLPPFNPSGVVEEISTLLKSYRLHSVTGDRYAGEWPREAFRSHGLEYAVSKLDRSAIYLELLPVVNAGTIEFPDDRKVLGELRALERRRGTSGRDRIDHRPGSHDDRANAIAGAVWLARQKSVDTMPPPLILSAGERCFDPTRPCLGIPYEAPVTSYFPDRWEPK
jgi:hypothetical protein